MNDDFAVGSMCLFSGLHLDLCLVSNYFCQMQIQATSSVDSLLELMASKYFKYIDVW